MQAFKELSFSRSVYASNNNTATACIYRALFVGAWDCCIYRYCVRAFTGQLIAPCVRVVGRVVRFYTMVCRFEKWKRSGWPVWATAEQISPIPLFFCSERFDTDPGTGVLKSSAKSEMEHLVRSQADAALCFSRLHEQILLFVGLNQYCVIDPLFLSRFCVTNKVGKRIFSAFGQAKLRWNDHYAPNRWPW